MSWSLYSLCNHNHLTECPGPCSFCNHNHLTECPGPCSFCNHNHLTECPGLCNHNHLTECPGPYSFCNHNYLTKYIKNIKTTMHLSNRELVNITLLQCHHYFYYCKVTLIFYSWEVAHTYFTTRSKIILLSGWECQTLQKFWFLGVSLRWFYSSYERKKIIEM